MPILLAIARWLLQEAIISRRIFSKGPITGLRVLFFSLLSIGLIFLDGNTPYLAYPKSLLNMAVYPVQYIVSAPLSFFDWVSRNLSAQQNLIEENTQLKAEQILLYAKLQELTALKNQNAALRNLVDTQTDSDKNILVAKVLAVSADPFVQEVLLDQGSNKHIYVGQAIVDAKGIMGQIISVTPLSSRAMLLSDPRSGIAVEDVRSGLRGILQGSGNNNVLSLENIPQTGNIAVGDALMSSGLDLKYPFGYPVGIVASIDKKVGQAFLKITVTPEANLAHSDLVLLLWESKAPLLLLKKEKAS